MFRITKLLLSMIFIQLMAKELAATNVALNQIAKDCNGKRVSGVIVDGNKDPSNDVGIETQCEGRHPHVEIYFVKSLKVHYVVVYAGKNSVPGQLDYFNVLVSHGSLWETCSEFSGLGIVSETGMRVNCEPLKGNQNKALIESRSDKGLSICEIEIHTLGSGIPGEGLRIFRGCFKQFGGAMETVRQPVFISCQVKCARGDYIFFGIKDGSTCICEYTYDEDEEIPKDKCSLICDDGKHLCGGPGVYSVYLTTAYLPTYRGCFDYPASPNFQDDMTIGKCIKRCDGFIYALLQDGKTCICDDAIDVKNSLLNKRCNMKCSGDSNEFCGGNGFVAVYETCKKKKFLSIKCSKIIMCDIYDRYGRCKGSCKPGFLGEHCLERDPSYVYVTKAKKVTTTQVIAWKTSETSVPAVQTSQTFVPTVKTSQTSVPTVQTSQTFVPAVQISQTFVPAVQTSQTFVPAVQTSQTSFSAVQTFQTSFSAVQTSQISVSELQATQSDACKILNPCINEENANCVAHLGKATCVCITGYTKDNRTNTCEDIDECIYEPCDNRYAFCLNLNGSYVCKCKPGYNATKSGDICMTYDFRETVEEFKFIREFPLAVFSALQLLSMFLLASLFWLHKSPEDETESHTPSDLVSADEDDEETTSIETI